MTNIHIENLTLNIHFVNKDGDVVPTVEEPKQLDPTPDELKEQSIKRAVRRMRMVFKLQDFGYPPEFIARLNL